MNIPGIENVNWIGGFTQIMYWTGWSLLSLLLIVVIGAAFYLLTFNYKLTVWPLYGSGKDGVFSFDKPKKNRVRWNKLRTSWQTMFPLFNNKEHEPFDSEYIYPGKNIYAFDLNGTLIPGRINIRVKNEELTTEVKQSIKDNLLKIYNKKYTKNKLVPCEIDITQTEQQIRTTINPVPHYIRNWQSLEHKKNQIEFSDKSWWDENKIFVYAVITIFICCALCAATIYFTFKFAGGGRQDIQAITSAIKQFGTIPGK